MPDTDDDFYSFFSQGAQQAAAGQVQKPQGPTPAAPPRAPASKPSAPRASGVIQANPGAPSPPPAPSKSPGVLSALGTLLNPFANSPKDLKQDADTVAGAAAGVLRSPGQLLGGFLDTANDAGTFVGDNINGALVRGAKAVGATGVADTLQKGLQQSHAAIPTVKNGGASLADTLSFRQSMGKIGNPNVNQFAAEGTAAAIPMLVAPEAVLGRAAAAAAGGAVALGADPQHPLVSRMENAGIAAGTEVGLSAVGSFVSSLSKAYRLPTRIVPATPEEGLVDQLDRGYGTSRTADAKAAQQAATATGEPAEPQAQEVVPPGRHTDWQTSSDGRHSDNDAAASGGTATGGRSGGDQPDRDGVPALPPHPALQDANAALEKAGAAERLPANSGSVEGTTADAVPRVLSDGRAVVSPATKEAVDRTPFGRAFAADNEADTPHVLYKELDSEGGRRIVYRSTPDDIQGFLDQVDHYASHPEALDIRPGSEAADRVGQWKLSSLGSQDDVVPATRALADQIQGHQEPVTDAQVAKMAQAMGTDPLTLATHAAEVADGAHPVLSHYLAVMTRARQTSEEVAALRGTDFRGMDPDHPTFLAARQSFHNAAMNAYALQQSKAAWGRVGGVLNRGFSGKASEAIDTLTRKLTPTDPAGEIEPQAAPDFDTWNRAFGKVPQERLDPVPPGSERTFPATPDEFQDAIDRIATARQVGPEAEANAWRGKAFAPNAWRYLLRNTPANWFSAALVSGPATIFRDIIGPGLLGGIQTLERTGGQLAEALKNSTFGDRSLVAGNLASASQAPLAYVQSIGAVLDSLRAGYDVALGRSEGLGARFGNVRNPLDVNTNGIPQDLIDAAAGRGDHRAAIAYSLGNAINRFPQAVHALHGGANELAVRQSFLGSVRAGAMQEASEAGLTGSDFWGHVSGRVMSAQDPLFDAASDKLYADAYDKALRTTYTKAVGSDAAPIVRSVGNLVQTLRENVPETRYILPIFNVPANALGESLRRIPALNLLFKETRSELLGQMGETAQADAFGRTLTGASLLLGGFQLARMGLITGAGPQQAADRQLWLAAGNQPYSIKLGGRWLSYQRLDVVGAMLGIMGGAYDQTIHQEEDNPNHIYAATAALAQYAKDQASLKGVSDLLSFGGNPTEDVGYFSRLTGDTARGFVPNFVTQLSRNNLDLQARIVRNPWEAIMNALPGTSQMLDPQRNLLGEDVYRPQALGYNMLPVTMGSSQPPHDSPILSELDRLMVKSGYAPGVIPPALHGGHMDTRDIKLEDGHSMYDAEQRYRGIVTNDDGQTLKEALTDLVNSEDYQQAADGTAHDAYDAGSKTVMLQKMFQDFTRIAKEQVATASPIAARYMAAAKVKTGNSGALGSATVQHLISPQGQSEMKALGIDFDGALDKVKGNQ